MTGNGPVITQPPLGRTVYLTSDSELGNHLLETRGLQWIHAANGDPYAVVLRGQLDDPYPEYERVRALGPLSLSATGSWVTADHAVAAEILCSPDFGMSAADGRPVPQQVVSYGSANPLESGGAERHGRAAEPGPETVGRHRALVERIHQEVVERTLAAGPEKDRVDVHGAGPHGFELMADFIRPAVTAATAAVLGVPQERRAQFGTCVERLRPLPDSLLAAQSLRTVRAAGDALAELDALPATGAGETPGGTVGDEHPPLRGPLCALGVATAVHLTGNAVLSLLAHPDQWRQLCARPELAAAAVEETLRHDPPVQLDARIALREVTLAGHRLRPGTHVVVLTAGTGRDPAAFTEPERFDLTRQDAARHLALHETGAHGPVAPLVRLQAEAALRALAGRFPTLRPAGPVLRLRRSPVSRGPLSVPVTG